MKNNFFIGKFVPTAQSLRNKKHWKWIAVIIMALAGTGAILHLLWKDGRFLPGWIEWESGSFCDRSGEYEIALERRAVSVRSGGTEVWASPEGVKVQAALSCDVDNDGEDELVLLCWKTGRYGRYRPFWVGEDEKKWSQHIFVYEYGHDGIRPKWMSSYIGQEVADIAIGGREETYYRLWLTDLGGNVSSWRWDSWGFSKEDTDVSFVVFGDNLIHEPIYRYGLNHGKNFDFLYENFGDILAESDVAVINQETPLTDKPARYGGYPRFGTPVQVGQAIADAGFDVVTCATNHALDLGKDGVNDTKGFFDSNGVLCLGIRAAGEEDCPYGVITRKGIRFALLNYTYGINGGGVPGGIRTGEHQQMVRMLDDEEKVRSDIGRAREDADFVVAFVHWGTEYEQHPDAFQQKWAQVFLDSGVDVVVGTHPHALQPYEILTREDGHGMLVYYSIGNFISAQSEKSCIKGGMAGFTVSLTSEGYQIKKYALRPLCIIWQRDGRYAVELASPMAFHE